MDRRTKILMDEFNPATEDGREWDDDLRLAITLNPDVDKIKNAMDEHMRECVLLAFEFVARETTGHCITKKEGKETALEFKYKGEWISKEKLFENFL
jgi:hypothetical protein